MEHFDAAMVNVSGLLTAVMEFETAVMAAMKLDVVLVSCSDTWVGDTYHGYSR